MKKEKKIQRIFGTAWFWKNIAIFSGGLGLFVCMLLIVNYFQYKQIDPVETGVINTLVDRLNQNPDDMVLREQIRTLDLLARKAYFTNRWQVRTGGYILIFSIGLLIIALQVVQSKTDKGIEIGENKSDKFIINTKAGKIITVSGLIIVGLAFVLGLLTHNDLGTNVLVSHNVVPETILTDNEIIVSDTVNEQQNSVEKEFIENHQEIAEETNGETEKSETIIEEQKSKETIKHPAKDEITNKEIVEESVPGKDNPIPQKKVTVSYPAHEQILSNHNAFRGPYGNGISYHKNIPVSWDGASGTNILWKIPVPLHGYNSPVIWENRIFLSGADSDKREVYCFDKNTGELLWTVPVVGVPGSPEKSPKVTDDTGQAAPSLTTDGNAVYAIFANGDLIAIDMNGEILWSRNLGPTNNHYGHSSSLLLYHNILIIQYDIKNNPKVMGINSFTGETLWETPRNVKVSWASPVIINSETSPEIILFADPFCASYDPFTGKENWSIKCTWGEVGPSPHFCDGIIYVVNEYAKLVAIKAGETPEILWESMDYMSDVPSPVATKDLLFMATSYGVMVCYDAHTGEIIWEEEFDNGFYSSPMLVEGKIYLVDNAGITHVFEAADEYKSMGTNPLGEKAMTTPAFDDGMIFIRSNNNLFCIKE